jgi:uncharacterized membrane protein
LDQHRRSVAKAISWRATGTVDTFVISFVLSGSLKLAGGIASVEVITKMVLYYLHERVWSNIIWGRSAPRASNVSSDAAATPMFAPVPGHEASAGESA